MGLVMLSVLCGPAWAYDTGATPTGATADTGTPDPALDLDQDGDGWTPRQGDCDDQQPEAYPNNEEVCEDRIDNDCDGLYDEGCDYRARIAGLRGGGGCTGTQAVAFLPLLGLLVLRRGRR